MSISLSGIRFAGSLDRERVVLKVTDDSNIGFYAVFKCMANKEGSPLSGAPENVYWFPDKQVQKGDLVVLYTKFGKRSEKQNENGTKSHFFYWKLKQAIWKAGTVPVLVQTPEWQTGKVELMS